MIFRVRMTVRVKVILYILDLPSQSSSNAALHWWGCFPYHSMVAIRLQDTVQVKVIVRVKVILYMLVTGVKAEVILNLGWSHFPYCSRDIVKLVAIVRAEHIPYMLFLPSQTWSNVIILLGCFPCLNRVVVGGKEIVSAKVIVRVDIIPYMLGRPWQSHSWTGSSHIQSQL